MVDASSAPRFSALPHALILDARTKHGHIVTYAVLQMHWWQGGECWANNATLSAAVKCSDPQLRRYLKDLVAWGFITERRRGQGQGKAYAPSTPTRGDEKADAQPITDERFNRSDMSASEPNRSPVIAQPLTGDQGNRSPVTHLKKTPEEDSSGRKNTPGVVDADASPPPPVETGKTKRSQNTTRAAKAPSPVTLAPESMELTERHLKYAADYGFTEPARVRAITDHFLSHHRFKGTKGRDWYAGWQGWIRNQRDIDDERAARRGGGPARTVPARPRTDDHLQSTAHLMEEMSETFHIGD